MFTITISKVVITMMAYSIRSIVACLLLLGGMFLCAPSTLAQQIVINGLRDIDFGQVAPTVGNLRASTSLCVALDQRAQYSITATSDSDQLEVRNGPYTIPYSVFFTDRRSQRNLRPLYYGTPLGSLRARGNFSGSCRRANAHVQVFFSGADLLSSASGHYSSTLVLMVSPE